MASVRVLGNPSAPDGRALLERVIRALRAADADATLLDAVTAESASEAARRAVADGATRLVAVGGDGVVSLAVNAVAGTGTVLGIVPDGTGNDFARAVGLLDGEFDDHVRRALAEPVAVDAIRTNHGWVASVATLGFGGDVTARANALRWPRGQQRYSVATFLQLPRLRSYPVEVHVDGRRLGDDTTLLAIGNTAYFGGGMRICPGTTPDDGSLQAVSVGDVPRWKFVQNFAAVFSGRHVERDEVAVDSGGVVTVDGGEDTMMWADGEPLGPLPVRLEVVPGALQVAGARLAD